MKYSAESVEPPIAEASAKKSALTSVLMLETSNDRYGCGDDALVASARARRANAAHEAMSDATTRAREDEDPRATSSRRRTRSDARATSAARGA